MAHEIRLDNELVEVAHYRGHFNLVVFKREGATYASISKKLPNALYFAPYPPSA